MDEFDIKTGGRIPIAAAESPRLKARRSQLVHVVFETSMSAYYTFPDLTQEMFTELLQQLDVRSEQVIVRNISGAMLVLPLRIIKRVSLLEIDEGARIHATSPHGGMSELWSAS